MFQKPLDGLIEIKFSYLCTLFAISLVLSFIGYNTPFNTLKSPKGILVFCSGVKHGLRMIF